MLKNKYVLILWLVVFFAGFCFAGPQEDLNKPDSIKVQSIPEVGPDQSFEVSVSLFSDESLSGLFVPLTFQTKGKFDIVCDSVTLSDWVLNYNPDIHVANVDEVNSIIRIGAVWFKKELPSGHGTLAKIYFHTGPKWKKDQGMVIDTTVCYPPPGGARYHFVSVKEKETISFEPVFVKGIVGKLSK